MTTRFAASIAVAGAATASCAKAVRFGPIGEGATHHPTIAAVDTTLPPKSVDVKLDRDGYVVVLLVAPGHSATLLYPRDSTTNNRFDAGLHQIPILVPPTLVAKDSTSNASNAKARDDYDRQTRQRMRNRSTGYNPPPLTPNTPTYLLVVTSPDRLMWARVINKTAGVSIPVVDSEALNAVGKAVKSTLEREPRDWSGYFQQVTLVQPK